jgi:hypothetical protein
VVKLTGSVGLQNQSEDTIQTFEVSAYCKYSKIYIGTIRLVRKIKIGVLLEEGN